MAVFNRKSKVQTPKNEGLGDFLNEYATSDGTNMYSFIQGIRNIDSNYVNNDILIERMKDDSIISSAIDMWTEDALQKDPQTKEIFNVEVETPDDFVEEKLSKGLSQELNRFLKDDLRMNKYLTPILKRILIYGNCPVKLDFADALDDDKLELKESAMEDFAKISLKAKDLFGDTTEQGSKSQNHQYAIDDKINRINEDCYKVDWEQAGEDIVKKDNRQLKKLQESIAKYYDTNRKILKESNNGKNLKEDELIETNRFKTYD